MKAPLGGPSMLTYSFGLDDPGFGKYWEGFGQGALGQRNVHRVGGEERRGHGSEAAVSVQQRDTVTRTVAARQAETSVFLQVLT